MARALLGVLGALPRPVAVAIGCGMGRLAYTLGRRLRHTGEINLELAFPQIDARQRSRILRGCFKSLGRLLGEFSQFPRATPESLRKIVEYDGLDNLLAAMARGRGVILLTSHLGAWELSSFAHSAFGYPHTFMVRRIDNPYLEQVVERRRTRFGNQSLDKKAAARKALRILREGGTIGILADLNTQPYEGVFVPFFGRLACTTTGIATLALRTGAAVVPAYMPWDESRKRYVIHFEAQLELVRTGDYKHDVEINTARFTAAIERQVRAYPDQWLWIHKRWQTRPTGEANLYSRPLKMNSTTGFSSSISKEGTFRA